MSSLVGREISHFRVLDELGRGGMGVAYRAEDLNLGRLVVLKVLPPEAAADPGRRERFRREARACSALKHPGITGIYEADVADGVYYICMEFVEGRTLRSLLAEAALPIQRALDLMTQVADAVAAAHAAGIVHRDLKPENVMVTPQRRIKVLDFGLAAMAAPGPGEAIGQLPTQVERLTSAGTRMGTPAYMSPEQALGRQVSPASDVFSLGSVLYEAIAGLPPFRGTNEIAVLHAVSYDNPPPLRLRRPDVPPPVEAVVRKALRKDPADRHPDAGAFRDDLMRCLRGMTPPLEALEPGRRATPPPRSTLSLPSLEAGPAPLPAPAPPPPPARLGVPADAPLVGRSREVAEMESAIESALEGRGQVVLVSGEAGIGKTRLVAECGFRFESRGVAYVVGRCLFKEGGLPYHPFVEAAERLVDLLGVESAEELTAYVRDRMPALGGRLPILHAFLHMPGAAAAEIAEAADKEHLLDAIAAFFVNVAREKPLLLHLDDLHWADEGTLDLFEYLARAFRRTRGALVGTYRPEEARGLVSRLSAGDVYVHLPLKRLGPADTEQILAAALPGARLDPTFVGRLHRDTAGNPFFVLEALRLLRADGLVRREDGGWIVDPGAVRAAIPGRVHDVVAQRLARLSAPERRLLEAAACEGATFRSTTLAACVGGERYEILGALQTLERDHRLIRPEEDRYRFDHPMVREVLYEGILPELRREYHGRIAAHLIRTASPDLRSEVEPAAGGAARPAGATASGIVAQRRTEAAAIAYQLLEAREEGPAVPYLVVAATHARTLFANHDALAALDRALGILTAECDVSPEEIPAERTRWLLKALKERGKLGVRLGRFDQARADFLEMRARARGARLPGKEAHAENLLADLSIRTGDYAAGMEHARRAHDLAQENGDRLSLASALAVMGVIHFNHGEFAEALAAHSRSIALQQSVGDLAGYADNLIKVAIIHFRQGRLEEALAVSTTALGIARQVQHRLFEAEALNNVGIVLYEKGDFEGSLKHYEEALALKREIGDRRSIARSLNNLGLLHEDCGAFNAALEAYKESLDLKRDLGDQAGISSSLSNLGSLFEKMGEYGRALECCEESLAVKNAIGETSTIPYCENALGRVRMALNFPSEAETLFRRALDGTRRQGDRPEECRTLTNLAELMLLTDRAPEAAGTLHEAASLAESLGLKGILVEISHLAGLAELQRGDLEAASRALERLRGARLRAPFRHLEALEEHLSALVLRARGRDVEAVMSFEAAAGHARDVGLRGLEWRILLEAGRTAEAREALLTLAEGVPGDGPKRALLASPRAAALFGPASA